MQKVYRNVLILLRYGSGKNIIIKGTNFFLWVCIKNKQTKEALK